MMSNGGGWWLLGVPLMIVCMVMMARMMSHGMMSHGHGGVSQTDSTSGDRHSDARRVLADRLARGEIDVEEYERRSTALQDRSEQDPT
jgi:uncharacterized membrane protein